MRRRHPLPGWAPYAPFLVGLVALVLTLAPHPPLPAPTLLRVALAAAGVGFVAGWLAPPDDPR